MNNSNNSRKVINFSIVKDYILLHYANGDIKKIPYDNGIDLTRKAKNKINKIKNHAIVYCIDSMISLVITYILFFIGYRDLSGLGSYFDGFNLLNVAVAFSGLSLIQIFLSILQCRKYLLSVKILTDFKNSGLINENGRILQQTMAKGKEKTTLTNKVEIIVTKPNTIEKTISDQQLDSLSLDELHTLEADIESIETPIQSSEAMDINKHETGYQKIMTPLDK